MGPTITTTIMATATMTTTIVPFSCAATTASSTSPTLMFKFICHRKKHLFKFQNPLDYEYHLNGKLDYEYHLIAKVTITHRLPFLFRLLRMEPSTLLRQEQMQMKSRC